jgi:selenocysteine lyase/cysteine desulfurase
LKALLAGQIRGTTLGQAELLEPPTGPARFLALRHPKAAEWQAALMAQDCITDVRGDVLRIGLGLYHDEQDVERFVKLAQALP